IFFKSTPSIRDTRKDPVDDLTVYTSWGEPWRIHPFFLERSSHTGLNRKNFKLVLRKLIFHGFPQGSITCHKAFLMTAWSVDQPLRCSFHPFPDPGGIGTGKVIRHFLSYFAGSGPFGSPLEGRNKSDTFHGVVHVPQSSVKYPSFTVFNSKKHRFMPA